jgi:hypothetical protein
MTASSRVMRQGFLALGLALFAFDGPGVSSDVVDFASSLASDDTYVYVYGAKGPKEFDCSGFTKHVFDNSGIDVPAGTASQKNVGTAVPKFEDLQRGDLVFFAAGTSSTELNHVGIYDGNGSVIHARNEKYGIERRSIADGFWKQRFLFGRRVLPDGSGPDPDPDPEPAILTVSVNGPGKVTSAQGNISCPSACSAELPGPATVTLTAQSNAGAVFSSWGGACSGSSPTCNVLVDGAKTVTATFRGSTPTQTWEGSFTAKGFFQLSDDCYWRYDEEFTNVRLSLREGGGTMTARVRTLEGPKSKGPSSCPDNSYVREQNDSFALVATSNGDTWSFELASGGIRTLQGTASSRGASGTYRLRTGALGAGGIRESNASFSLKPAR